MTGSSDTGYQLGSDAAELERLDLQGRVLAPATRKILETVGLGSGMRVLDLGSGAGDVAFVAAELVGSAGEVVGLDQSPSLGRRCGRRCVAFRTFASLSVISMTRHLMDRMTRSSGGWF